MALEGARDYELGSLEARRDRHGGTSGALVYWGLIVQDNNKGIRIAIVPTCILPALPLFGETLLTQALTTERESLEEMQRHTKDLVRLPRLPMRSILPCYQGSRVCRV